MSNYWLDKKKQTPEKIVLYIDVGQMPPEVFLNCLKDQFRKQQNIDLNPGPYDAPEFQCNEKGWDVDL